MTHLRWAGRPRVDYGPSSIGIIIIIFKNLSTSRIIKTRGNNIVNFRTFSNQKTFHAFPFDRQNKRPQVFAIGEVLSGTVVMIQRTKGYVVFLTDEATPDFSPPRRQILPRTHPRLFSSKFNKAFKELPTILDVAFPNQRRHQHELSVEGLCAAIPRSSKFAEFNNLVGKHETAKFRRHFF